MRTPKNVLLVPIDENLAAILENGLRKGGYRVSTMLGTKLKWAIRENIAAIGNLDKKGRTALADLESAGMRPLVFLHAPRRRRGDYAGGESSKGRSRWDESASSNCIEADARRSLIQRSWDKVKVADLELDIRAQVAFRSGRKLRLTHTEFLLLARLVLAGGRIVPRNAMVREVWGGKNRHSNALEAMIYRLRTKVDRPFRVKLIQTAPGMGYCLDIGKAPIT
jgi:DNA-binding winged helix-turn-helix (wHTH) protein